MTLTATSARPFGAVRHDRARDEVIDEGGRGKGEQEPGVIPPVEDQPGEDQQEVLRAPAEQPVDRQHGGEEGDVFERLEDHGRAGEVSAGASSCQKSSV